MLLDHVFHPAAKPHPEPLELSPGARVPPGALALVIEAVACATGKTIDAIENGDPPPAIWASKPRPLAAKVAGRPDHLTLLSSL